MIDSATFDRIAQRIEAERGGMQELLAELVAIPTENPPATEYLSCVELLESVLNRLDRKSTRLNSSHTVISYAVFCMKKKKKLQITHTPKVRGALSESHLTKSQDFQR